MAKIDWLKGQGGHLPEQLLEVHHGWLARLPTSIRCLLLFYTFWVRNLQYVLLAWILFQILAWSHCLHLGWHWNLLDSDHVYIVWRDSFGPSPPVAIQM